MKTRVLKYGPTKYKAYFKSVGKGYEVGLTQGTKPLFVGNFISGPEARTWYTKMNKEVTKFAKRYKPVPNKKPSAFVHKFISNSLYKHYYDFLDKCFGKHNRNYTREFNKNLRKWNKMNKRWTKGGTQVRRAA